MISTVGTHGDRVWWWYLFRFLHYRAWLFGEKSRATSSRVSRHLMRFHIPFTWPIAFVNTHWLRRRAFCHISIFIGGRLPLVLVSWDIILFVRYYHYCCWLRTSTIFWVPRDYLLFILVILFYACLPFTALSAIPKHAHHRHEIPQVTCYS